MRTEFKKVTCKSLINKSNIPNTQYAINPYTGCTHGCVYCYAKFMKRYTSHMEKWGEFVDIKINASEVLEKQLTSRKKYDGTVLIGSVTDAYQPVELKYKITRRVLKTLLKYQSYHQLNVSILTKSYNVIRDIDLLRNFDNCEVGVSISNLDKKFAKVFEPFASPPEKRIKALKVLKENGIRTYLFMSPVFPGFSDVQSVVEATKSYVDFVMAEALNYKCGNWRNIEYAMKRYYPKRWSDFTQLLKDNRTWIHIENRIKGECKKYELSFRGLFLHK